MEKVGDKGKGDAEGALYDAGVAGVDAVPAMAMGLAARQSRLGFDGGRYADSTQMYASAELSDGEVASGFDGGIDLARRLGFSSRTLGKSVDDSAYELLRSLDDDDENEEGTYLEFLLSCFVVLMF